METRKNLIFVSSSISQPRHQKRIASLATTHNVFVLYFTRAQYKENIASFTHPEELTCCVGTLENRNYHKRLMHVWKLARAIYKRKGEPVYSTSLEGAIIGVLLRRQVTLELGDLHQFGRFEKLYKAIDKFLVPRLHKLVLTSPYFVTEYYGKLFPEHEHKMIVLENKLPHSLKPMIDEYRSKPQRPLDPKKIRLGLVGGIRYEAMLTKVAELMRSRSGLELHIFGDGATHIFDGVPNCINHGPFKNPDDLPRIYETIDINLILYDTSIPNVKWALPNKLYESIAFWTPILCSNACALGTLVEELGIGEAAAIGSLDEKLNEISNNIAKCSARCSELPPDEYIATESLISGVDF